MEKIRLNVGKCKRERGIKRVFKEFKTREVVDTGNDLPGPLFVPMASTPNCRGYHQLRLTGNFPVWRNALRTVLSREPGASPPSTGREVMVSLPGAADS